VETDVVVVGVVDVSPVVTSVVVERVEVLGLPVLASLFVVILLVPSVSMATEVVSDVVVGVVVDAVLA